MEEELRLLNLIKRHLIAQQKNDNEQGYDKGFNGRTLEHEREHIVDAVLTIEVKLRALANEA